MRSNSKMSALLNGVDISRAFSNGEGLDQTDLPEIEINNDSVLLKKEYERNRHVRVTAFPDRTGFEAFINHVHLPFSGTRESLLSCLDYAAALRRALTPLVGLRRFKIILSIEKGDCSVRFHEIRVGENWVAENLEEYADEAIIVLDIP